MPTAQKKTSPKKISKKEARLHIAELLEKALAGIKESMGEKKFNNNIKKASKLFVIANEPKKATKTVKKVAPVKKVPVAAPKAKAVKKTE